MIDEEIDSEDLAPDSEEAGDAAPEDLLKQVTAPQDAEPDYVDEPDVEGQV